MRSRAALQSLQHRAFTTQAQNKPIPKYDDGKIESGSSMPTIPNLQKLRRFYKKANVIEHPLSDKVEKL